MKNLRPKFAKTEELMDIEHQRLTSKAMKDLMELRQISFHLE